MGGSSFNHSDFLLAGAALSPRHLILLALGSCPLVDIGFFSSEIYSIYKVRL